jgi:hypothetical protein
MVFPYAGITRIRFKEYNLSLYFKAPLIDGGKYTINCTGLHKIARIARVLVSEI